MVVCLMKKILFLLITLAFTPLVFGGSAVVYKSESCGHCAPYVEKLFPMLERNGFQASDVVVKDFLSDSQARAEVAQIQKDFGVPLEMQGHMLTLIDGKYLFEGHVPLSFLENFLKNDRQNFDKIVVTQDSMDENAPSYLLLDSQGKVRQCSVTQSAGECEEQGGSESGSAGGSLLKFKVDSNLLVLVLLGIVLVALALLQTGVLK